MDYHGSSWIIMGMLRLSGPCFCASSTAKPADSAASRIIIFRLRGSALLRPRRGGGTGAPLLLILSHSVYVRAQIRPRCQRFQKKSSQPRTASPGTSSPPGPGPRPPDLSRRNKRSADRPAGPPNTKHARARARARARAVRNRAVTLVYFPTFPASIPPGPFGRGARPSEAGTLIVHDFILLHAPSASSSRKGDCRKSLRAGGKRRGSRQWQQTWAARRSTGRAAPRWRAEDLQDLRSPDRHQCGSQVVCKCSVSPVNS